VENKDEELSQQPKNGQQKSTIELGLLQGKGGKPLVLMPSLAPTKISAGNDVYRLSMLRPATT